MKDVLTAGRIVNIQPPRSFISKKDGTQKFYQGFILKDDTDVIEVKIWMDNEQEKQYYNSFKLDDFVFIQTNSVQKCGSAFPGPSGVSPPSLSYAFHQSSQSSVPIPSVVLHVNSSRDSTASMFLDHPSVDKQSTSLDINSTFKTPLREVSDTSLTPLSILNASCSAANRLLLMVKSVHPPSPLMTKNGATSRRIIVLSDEDNTQVKLTLWGDSCALADSWRPKYTVLLCYNVNVSEFSTKTSSKSTSDSDISLSLSHRTLIEIDPDCDKAKWLRNVAMTWDDYGLDQTQSVKFQPTSGDGASMGSLTISPETQDLRKITNVFSIAQLNSVSQDLSGLEVVYGILHPMVSSIQIDQMDLPIVVSTCAKCESRTPTSSLLSCPKCSGLPGDTEQTMTYSYELSRSSQITIVDFSAEILGSLIFTNAAVEELLGFSPVDYLELSETERVKLKREVLFEECKVYFKLFLNEFQKPVVSIISAKLANLAELQ
ncbi:hypothetical protein BKA69DRAFT_1083742 [Paraphysoderma sedebokerense]|nr:hypothetical protein BKA69DRAFT_1083742 [Paraphysoderma sedebokerense]